MMFFLTLTKWFCCLNLRVTSQRYSSVIVLFCKSDIYLEMLVINIILLTFNIQYIWNVDCQHFSWRLGCFHNATLLYQGIIIIIIEISKQQIKARPFVWSSGVLSHHCATRQGFKAAGSFNFFRGTGMTEEWQFKSEMRWIIFYILETVRPVPPNCTMGWGPVQHCWQL